MIDLVLLAILSILEFTTNPEILFFSSIKSKTKGKLLNANIQNFGV